MIRNGPGVELRLGEPFFSDQICCRRFNHKPCLENRGARRQLCYGIKAIGCFVLRFTHRLQIGLWWRHHTSCLNGESDRGFSKLHFDVFKLEFAKRSKDGRKFLSKIEQHSSNDQGPGQASTSFAINVSTSISSPIHKNKPKLILSNRGASSWSLEQHAQSLSSSQQSRRHRYLSQTAKCLIFTNSAESLSVSGNYFAPA